MYKTGVQRVPSAEHRSGYVLLQIAIGVCMSVIAADWLSNNDKPL